MRKTIFKTLFVCSLCFISSLSLANLSSNRHQAETENLSVYLNQIISSSKYRNHTQVEELNRVSAWIQGQMQKFGIPCDFQNYMVESNRYRNVVCELNVGAAKNLIVGAHYDVHGETDGADDNASGVAGVLETARILAKEKRHLKHNVEFVFYTLEEPPYFRTKQMGSAVHAKAMEKYKDRIAGVFILEMIGYFDQRNIQEYPAGLKFFYPAHGNFIGAVSNFDSNLLGSEYCAAMKQINRLDCQRLVAPSFVTGVDFSDHLNYWNAGIPAVMITDTAFFRNKNYHTVNDKVETLNLQKMKHVIDGVVLTILNIK
ncbi:MAG: M20/M25/M40 family metallo-hydrolase [Acinetobacter sp.]|nr:M20/M25/M40 family metallo-hydrolase [Acinetobacter sp.]